MNKRWRVAQFWEIRWWQWYLEKKEKATYLEQKAAYWNRVLKTCEVEIKEDQSILDAGCGPAGIFMILPPRQLTAIDPLLEAYEQQLIHFKKEEYPHVKFFASSLEDFQPGQSYDIIFCCNAINHVADLTQSLDKIIDWLKPGGTLILTVDVHNFNLLKHLFRCIPGDILHPHQHSLEDYLLLLEGRKLKMGKVARLKTGLIFDYYLIKATSPFKVCNSPLVISKSTQ